MQPSQESAAIIRVEKLTDDIVRLTLQAPVIAAACRPGQFVMVRLARGYDPLLRRPLSVHQVTDDGLQVLLKVVGRGTAALAASVEGDCLDIVGPLGHGFDLSPAPPACLVGGGIGVAPLVYLAKELLRRCEPNDISVLVGAASRVEAAALARQLQTLNLVVQIATDDGSLGHHGLVTELLAMQTWNRPRTVYSCGPFAMMRAVAGLCGANNWPCQVSLEAMMACGVAACLGCAIPANHGHGYVHVCKDGPVFQADDVVWESSNQICACE